MAKKYLPQNKVGASRTKPMPERRSGMGLPSPTGRQRPGTTNSPRGSGVRGRIDNKRGPGGAPPGGEGGGGNRIKGGGTLADGDGGAVSGMG
jgi:hypothetical protein